MTKDEYVQNRIGELGESYRKHSSSKSEYDKIITMECGDWPLFRGITSFELTLKLLLNCRYTRSQITSKLNDKFPDRKNENGRRPDRILNVFLGDNKSRNITRYSEGDVVGLEWDQYKFFDSKGNWVKSI